MHVIPAIWARNLDIHTIKLLYLLDLPEAMRLQYPEVNSGKTSIMRSRPNEIRWGSMRIFLQKNSIIHHSSAVTIYCGPLVKCQPFSITRARLDVLRRENPCGSSLIVRRLAWLDCRRRGRQLARVRS